MSLAAAPAAQAQPRVRGASPVVAQAVEHRFRGGAGLGPIDLRVEHGEVLGVMGPNGSGKTTLLLVVAALLVPQRGELQWWGRTDPGAARRELGVALDGTAEDGALSGRQATTFWCRQWVRDPAEARELAEEALRELGLQGVADRAVGGYSFGMRRRLGLAQAVAHRPQLLLLDEPTAGLDPDGVADLGALLHRRKAAGGATLLASNDAGFVAEVADRVLLLDRGRLLHTGTPAELLARSGPGRWAEVDTDEPASLLVRLGAMAGLGRCERVPGGVRVQLGDERALGQVVLAAESLPGGLRALRVHETDLADCFRQLAGRGLVEEPRR